MFENMVLRRIFGAKGEEVVGGWRRLDKDGLQNLYTSPNIKVIKSRMRWIGHIARAEKRQEMCTKFWSENLKGRDHFEDLGIDGRTRSGWVLNKSSGKVWADFIWLRIGTSGGIL
jgi:hypothetical protein